MRSRSRWTPAVVFAALTFVHALALPTFEGIDEPAHLSSILQFAGGQGRPVPGRARLHASIERAIALVPGPYHQWDAARQIGGATYAEWRRLGADERARRDREFKALDASSWRDGAIENWQAQHPPLYYAIVGTALRISGAHSLRAAHLAARLISATMFATIGILLVVFVGTRWGASTESLVFVTLWPMWYVMGARVANDALAMPALGLALLLAIDQLRHAPSEWRPVPWLAAGAAAAVGLAAKAYGLAFVPVTIVAAGIAAIAWRRGTARAASVLYPSAALMILLVGNAWWLAENSARGAGLTGQNENASLAERGIVSMGDRLPYARALVLDQPRQAMSAAARATGQALYASNWTIGAAPWWFYVAELTAIAAVALAAWRRRAWPPPLRAAAIVAAVVLVTLAIGIAKSVLDFFILFGETRLAQGFYVWAGGVAFAATAALALDLTSRRGRRVLLAVQLVCLLTAMATDLMFWSGRYERDPVWRTPVRVSGFAGPPVKRARKPPGKVPVRSPDHEGTAAPAPVPLAAGIPNLESQFPLAGS